MVCTLMLIYYIVPSRLGVFHTFYIFSPDAL